MGYALAALGVAWGELAGWPLLVGMAKPLAMPLLAAWAWPCLSKQKLLVPILVFSWVGDIALLWMPDPTKPPVLWGIPRGTGFFLVGLGSFAVVHGLYMRSFFRRTSSLPLWAYGLLIAYGAGMLSYLWVHMGAFPERRPLRPAVVFYGLLILGMAIGAASRWKQVEKAAFWQGLMGALLFVLSDSLIGLNYLAWERPSSVIAAAIFLSYAAAQGLLVQALCLTLRLPEGYLKTP